MDQKVQTFLNKASDLPKIIVIYGPTASGKTSMSIDIAKELDTEVISADSRQIYRGMDIGTGKVTEQEMEGVFHHMLDIRNPDEGYSVGEYVREVEPIIDRLIKLEKTPIICGGTGLYIDSLIYQFDIPEIPADEKYREELEKIREIKGNDALWKLLQEKDPEYAQELHPNNWPYIIRALEVLKHTGKSKKDLKVRKEKKYDVLLLTPFEQGREKLYARINERVKGMFDDGLVEEVRGFVGDVQSVEDVIRRLPGLDAIGYKEVLEHLAGDIDLDRCIELVQQHSRNYAKRQLTWFRRYTQG